MTDGSSGLPAHAAHRRRRPRYRLPFPQRSQHHPQESLQSPPDQPRWRHLLAGLSSLLLLLGVLFYGMLSMVYARFYEPLGVDPADVGLGYASVLSHAVSYIALVLVMVGAFILGVTVAAVFLGLTTATWKAIRQEGFLTPRAGDKFAEIIGELYERALSSIRKIKPGHLLSGATIMIAWLLLFPFLLLGPAGIAAAQVREGHPIIPIKAPPLGIQILAVRADPVEVSPAAKSAETREIETLAKKTGLLYLGQAGGTAVLYDHTQGRAIYLPASTILLKVVACRTSQSDSRCAQGVPL
jgi:hypothetical protein